MRQSFAISFPPLPDDGPVPGMFGLIRKYCWLLLGSQLSIGLYFAIAIAIAIAIVSSRLVVVAVF